jgi:hypothetical protein
METYKLMSVPKIPGSVARSHAVHARNERPLDYATE